jgi:hypothetical protein
LINFENNTYSNYGETMKLKTFPIFLVFLAMGFGDVVGPLVGLAKDTFQIS